MHGQAQRTEVERRFADRPRVVILGAGFAGLNAAIALRRSKLDVLVIDRQNHHLFQPLLYQVATAGLSPGQIATPIRQILARQNNASVLLDEVEGIDLGASMVMTAKHAVAFDYLIVATGARHAYFGNHSWEIFAPGLKNVSEAITLRRKMLQAFERAEFASCKEDCRKLLTFAVVGAGPTGVEMAGAIAELARKTLASDFRNIDPSSARVVLVEAGPHVLPSFPLKLSLEAKRQLERIGVEVLTNTSVVACGPTGVSLSSGEKLETTNIVWCAGVMASPAAQWLGVAADKAGRVVVGQDLRLPEHRNVFVIGDTAAVTDVRGARVPGVAPAAKQMGRYTAEAIRADLAKKPVAPFRYRHYGNMATIGRKAAVADFRHLRFAGFTAWILWSLLHVGVLIGFRNRMTVMLDWAWSYFTYGRGVRLITGSDAN